MTWLVDTNVISELRKGPRADAGVALWMSDRSDEAFLSALTIGEIRRGIELRRRRDPTAAQHLEFWLLGLLQHFESKILPIDHHVAEVWGRLGVPDPIPVADGLIAATDTHIAAPGLTASSVNAPEK